MREICVGVTLKELSIRTIEGKDSKDNNEGQLVDGIPYFFDRTVNKGKPVTRILNIKDFGIYIDHYKGKESTLFSYSNENIDQVMINQDIEKLKFIVGPQSILTKIY